LGDYFSQSLDELPPNLESLTIRSKFNRRIDKLPNSLKYLEVGNWFNQPIDWLPKSMTHLTTGHAFNQSIDNLPPSITHLTLGYLFNQSIDNLSSNIKYLGFCSRTPMNNIPASVDTVKIYFSLNDCINGRVENLPMTIKKIIVTRISKLDLIKIPFGCEVVEEKLFIP
jgi:hypothetical protein